jgi:hypothetical protein
MFEPILISKPDEKETKTLDFYEQFRRRHSDDVSPPEIVLSVNGQMVATRQNIFGITGKAKAGKSFALSLLIAAVLQKGEFQGVISSYLPKGRDKVILFDTEQSTYHISVILDRIKKLGTTDYQMENLITYSFDTITSKLRREYFEDIIIQTQGVGLVLIDGLADLVGSINDEENSANMLDDLRAFATSLNIAIGYVLHQNPSDNLKMRGHLGSIATNKSESVFQVITSKENKSVKLVEFLDTRNKQPENFAFEILENGVPELVEYDFGSKPTERKLSKKDTLLKVSLEVIEECFYSENQAVSIGYGELLDRVKRAYLRITNDTLGENYAKAFIKDCVETSKICFEPASKRYFLCEFI